MCSLDQLLPGDFQRVLGDKPELQSYAKCLLLVERRLGLEKHRALAQAASSEAPVSMGVGALEPEPSEQD
eukprot:14943614-Alexandrium_andersonii.AAC.1